MLKSEKLPSKLSPGTHPRNPLYIQKIVINICFSVSFWLVGSGFMLLKWWVSLGQSKKNLQFTA